MTGKEYNEKEEVLGRQLRENEQAFRRGEIIQSTYEQRKIELEKERQRIGDLYWGSKKK